jgi:hypothetical protein
MGRRCPVNHSCRNHNRRAYLPVGRDRMNSVNAAASIALKSRERIARFVPSYLSANSRWSPSVSPGQYAGPYVSRTVPSAMVSTRRVAVVATTDRCQLGTPRIPYRSINAAYPAGRPPPPPDSPASATAHPLNLLRIIKKQYPRLPH